MKTTPHLTKLEYVNLNGEVCSLTAPKPKQKRQAPDASAFHKGWRVTGFSPAHMEQALIDHGLEQEAALKEGREPRAWNQDNYIRTHNGRPVRSKPYEIREAAYQCADMAKRSGWLGVQVAEVKRDASGPLL